ncbi:ArsR/SmtB family transcription factor [Streptomyces sp. DSM 118878]
MRRMNGDHMLRVASALANPHRLRIIAALSGKRSYVSELAREIGISRALLQVHLRKLEAAELVTAELQLSEDGKAMKYYEVAPFAFLLDPETITDAAQTLTPPGDGSQSGRKESSDG